jgi:hypothetical protein
MIYLYGWSWHEEERHPIEEMTEDEARAAFDAGPQVSVVALEEPGGVPAYTLTMDAGAHSASVTHYTAAGSIEARFHYARLGSDDRLFLEQVTEYLYPDDGAFHSELGSLARRTYRFWPDGRARVKSLVREAGGETVERLTGVNVSDHWVDPISWGDWDRIGTYQPSAT